MHFTGTAAIRTGQSLLIGLTLGLIASCTPQESAVLGDLVDANDPGALTATDDASRTIVVSPLQLDYRDSIDELLLVVRHFASQTPTYEITTDADWISIDRPSGSIDGGWVWLKVRVDRSRLTRGEHLATLTVSTSNAGPVEVGLRVDAPNGPVAAGGSPPTDGGQAGGMLSLSTQRLDFGQAGATLSFLIQNTGPGTLGYTLSTDVAWASLSATRGESSGEVDFVEVTVERAALDSGAHFGIVDIGGDNGETHAVALSLFNPSPNDPVQPELFIDRDVLNFAETFDGRSFQLSNAGAGAVAYTISSDSDWLSASPASGSVTAAADAIEVTVDRARLSPDVFHVGVLHIAGDTGLDREVLAVAFEPGASDSSSPAFDDAQILEWMRALPPLPKVHYSWPLPPDLRLSGLDPKLFETVRITHAASFSASWGGEQELNTYVELCKQVNDTNPPIRARLGLNYSPWHMVFPTDSPPTDFGPDHDAELALYRERLELARDRLAGANAAFAANVEVGAILLDSERFFRKDPNQPDYETYNAAIDAKYNAIYQISKEIFPNAPVVWFNRGLSRNFTLNEMGDGYSAAAYRVPNLELERGRFQRAYDRALASGETFVTPWVALGAGWEPVSGGGERWTFNWDFPLFYSWQIGAEVNTLDAADADGLAPWAAADFVVLYPEPFGRTDQWGKHFVAYVRGAHLIPQLPN